MTAKITCPSKFLFEVSNKMVSSDDSTKKGTQLPLIEESYFNKESDKQFRSRYDQFISTTYVAASLLLLVFKNVPLG